MFESESLRGNPEKSEGKGEGSSESLGGDFDEDGFCAERGGYKVTGSLDQGKLVMEPCGEKDMFMVSQESFVIVADKISLTLRARDYKAPNAVCYEEPVVAIEGNGQRPSHRGAGHKRQ